MTTPNPLIPQGSFQNQRQGNPNVRIAVFTIVAIHAVFFGGLLMQGCKRDTQTAGTDQNTNALAAAPEENFLPSMDTNFYLNYEQLTQQTSSPEMPALPLPEPGRSEPLTTPLPGTGSNPISSPPRLPVVSEKPKQPNAVSPVSNLLAEPVPELKEYTVARGDNLSKIAQTHGVTLAAIKEANPSIDPNRIFPGQKIMLPPPSQEKNGRNNSEPVADGKMYVVKPGDNLTRIAEQHGTTVQALKAANNLRTDRIYAKQRLVLPNQTNTVTQ